MGTTRHDGPELALGDAGESVAPRVGRNIAALASGQAVTWAMTLLWTLVVPRALGPAGMGWVVAAWSVTGVLGIVLGLGTRTYLVRELVVNRAAGPRLVGTAIVLRVVSAPLFICAVVVYSRLADYGHDATLVLYLFAGATLLTLVAEPMQAAFQALERMQYLAYSDVITKSAQGLLGIGLVLIGFRAVGIAACALVVAAVVIALNARWLRGQLAIDLRTSTARLREMTKASFAYWAFGIFFLIYLWIDAVMLSLMTRAEVVGWYGVPTKLFQTLMFLPVIVSTAWLPRLVSAFEQGREQLDRTARAPLELVLLLSLPICAATVVGARPAVHLLYGSAYDESIPVLVILGLCVPPIYLNIMLSQVLIAANRLSSWTRVMAGATVLNPLVNLALIPLTDDRYGNGAIGAALSLLVTEIVIVSVGFAMVGRHVLDQAALRRCARVAAASLAMWATAYAASPLGPLASIVTGGGTFVLAAIALRVATPEERSLLRSQAARLLRRIPGTR